MDYAAAFERIVRDPRYLCNLDWGEPRPGHPEGSIRAHIADLEANLNRLRPQLEEQEYQKLRLLAHVHDTFKPDAHAGVAIAHRQSHASLARAFLSEFVADPDLLAMIQLHDEPHALWRGMRQRGACHKERFEALLRAIDDWRLFTAFLIMDGCLEGKERECLKWFLAEIEGKVESRFGVDDML